MKYYSSEILNTIFFNQSVVLPVVEAVEPPSYHVDLVVGLPVVEEHVDAKRIDRHRNAYT